MRSQIEPTGPKWAHHFHILHQNMTIAGTIISVVEQVSTSTLSGSNYPPSKTEVFAFHKHDASILQPGSINLEVLNEHPSVFRGTSARPVGAADLDRIIYLASDGGLKNEILDLEITEVTIVYDEWRPPCVTVYLNIFDPPIPCPYVIENMVPGRITYPDLARSIKIRLALSVDDVAAVVVEVDIIEQDVQIRTCSCTG